MPCVTLVPLKNMPACSVPEVTVPTVRVVPTIVEFAVTAVVLEEVVAVVLTVPLAKGCTIEPLNSSPTIATPAGTEIGSTSL